MNLFNYLFFLFFFFFWVLQLWTNIIVLILINFVTILTNPPPSLSLSPKICSSQATLKPVKQSRWFSVLKMFSLVVQNLYAKLYSRPNMWQIELLNLKGAWVTSTLQKALIQMTRILPLFTIFRYVLIKDGVVQFNAAVIYSFNFYSLSLSLT